MSFVFVALMFLIPCVLTVFIEALEICQKKSKNVNINISSGISDYQSHTEINLTIIIDKNNTGNSFVTVRTWAP